MQVFRRGFNCLVFSFLLLLYVPEGQAATITVTSDANAGAGTLRQAIADAITGDTINFNLSYPATITTTSTLAISGKNLTIAGPGSSQLMVTPSHTGRIFTISGGAGVSISGLKVSGAASTSIGGAFSVNGNLTLQHCIIADNTAISGGGIDIRGGELTVADCEFTNNTVNGLGVGGGAIFAFAGTSLTLDNVLIKGNRTTGSGTTGGGIFMSGLVSARISNSRIEDNISPSYGGGIYWVSDNPSTVLQVYDSTLKGNSNTAQSGGGIWARGSISLNRCLLQGNSSSYFGGGLAVYQTGTTSESFTTTLTDCVFDGNSSGAVSGAGGGAYLSGRNDVLDHVSIDGCLFTGNTSSRSGGGLGIRNHSAVIRNSTFYGNTSDGSCGGGIYIVENSGVAPDPGQIQLSFVTVTKNISDYDCTSLSDPDCDSSRPGGGICLVDSPMIPGLMMKSSVVAGNRFSRLRLATQFYADLSAGDYTSSGYNLIGHKGSSSTGFIDGVNHDQVGGAILLDAKLEDLADNGGPTMTCMPESSSPLINAGGPATDVEGIAVAMDQRGKRRLAGSAADIGAVEKPSSMNCFPIRKVGSKGCELICF